MQSNDPSIVDLSVIAPMYNEGRWIEKNIERLLDTLTGREDNWELILVNDGSVDNTLDLVREKAKKEPRLRVVTYPENRGRGYALRQGFRAARGKYVVTTESDLNWGTEIINKLYGELRQGSADMVIASPYLEGGKLECVPWNRVFLSKFGNKILTWAVPGKLSMVSGMTRGYRKEVLDSLLLESDGKEIHLEIVSKAIANGFRVVELPEVLSWKGQEARAIEKKSGFRSGSLIRSHLNFSFYEKPMMLFGGVGLILLILGTIFAFHIMLLRFKGTLTPNRPLVTLTIIFILAGIQILTLGFVANYIGALRKEMFKIQKQNRDLEKKVTSWDNSF